jgi:hypothetical protein
VRTASPPRLTSADGSDGLLVVVQVVTDADLVALDEIIRTFNVVA